LVPASLLEAVGQILTWPGTHQHVVEASKLVPDEIVQMICATCPILYPAGHDVSPKRSNRPGPEQPPV
jgi:hypothetical protein